jgi:type II secretory pathway component PulF
MIFLATTLIPMTASMTAQFTDEITGIIGDLSPLWLIVIGVGVGLIVVSGIVSAIRGHH